LSPDSVNIPFSPDEQAEVSARLKEIAKSIKKVYKLTAEQSAKLDEKFEEAEKASRRMGRKDWGLLFGGAVLTLILSDTITPAIMGDILMMVQHGLGHLFGGASC
jgi:tetrahydromethanopterin S-methyltransferase subunit G